MNIDKCDCPNNQSFLDSVLAPVLVRAVASISHKGLWMQDVENSPDEGLDTIGFLVILEPACWNRRVSIAFIRILEDCVGNPMVIYILLIVQYCISLGNHDNHASRVFECLKDHLLPIGAQIIRDQ